MQGLPRDVQLQGSWREEVQNVLGKVFQRERKAIEDKSVEGVEIQEKAMRLIKKGG